MYENKNDDMLTEEIEKNDAEGVVLEAEAEERPMEEAIIEETPIEEMSIEEVPEEPEAAKEQITYETFCAKDIQPRKKTGWGKRIAVLLLSGILLGSSAAGAYLGVTYFGKKFLPQQENTLPADTSEEQKKEPEISKAETITGASQGDTASSVGIAYDVSGVVDNVMPAMVSIINKYTETYETWFGQSYSQENASSGSGIIIGENETELLIATNYHVVSGSDDIQITFIDGTTATAYTKGTDPKMDLAVVSVVLDTLTEETKTAIAVASLGNSEDLRLGEPVIAIGNALGYGQSVTTGVVSAVNRKLSVEEGATEGSFIQTDAAINPGNSGGALLNMKGQVIGINSSKIGGSAIEGMGYAIPISAAEPIISDLSLQTTKIKVDEAERGYLGISIQEVTANYAQMFGMPQGVYIAELVKDGAAEKAGMQIRDIIVKFDTFQINSYADLQDALQYYAAGTTVPVEVMRINGNQYESVTLELTLGKRPAE